MAATNRLLHLHRKPELVLHHRNIITHHSRQQMFVLLMAEDAPGMNTKVTAVLLWEREERHDSMVPLDLGGTVQKLSARRKMNSWAYALGPGIFSTHDFVLFYFFYQGTYHVWRSAFLAFRVIIWILGSGQILYYSNLFWSDMNRWTP